MHEAFREIALKANETQQALSEAGPPNAGSGVSIRSSGSRDGWRPLSAGNSRPAPTGAGYGRSTPRPSNGWGVLGEAWEAARAEGGSRGHGGACTGWTKGG